jgi:hypothetical protein
MKLRITGVLQICPSFGIKVTQTRRFGNWICFRIQFPKRRVLVLSIPDDRQIPEHQSFCQRILTYVTYFFGIL